MSTDNTNSMDKKDLINKDSVPAATNASPQSSVDTKRSVDNQNKVAGENTSDNTTPTTPGSSNAPDQSRAFGNRDFSKPQNSRGGHGGGKKKWQSNKRFAKSEFEEQVIKVKRVSKTTKGGRQSRIWILVVVGNKKGRVGYGIGKSKEFPIAIKKATRNATKNAIKVPINHKGTVYHEYLGKYNSSKVLIKPAKQGTGIIAGGPIKKILELAGYQNIYSKNLGSNSPINMLHATMDALLKQRSPSFIAKLRDKTFKELFHI